MLERLVCGDGFMALKTTNIDLIECNFNINFFSLKFRRVPRRRQSKPDEGWVDWPVLGEGWKRKEVVRRSGSSMGQKDVYYMG